MFAPSSSQEIALHKSGDKDDHGVAFPSGIGSGQVTWSVPWKSAGRGRLLQSNPNTAMARSFSCGLTLEVCQAPIYNLIDEWNYMNNVTYGTIYPQECLNSCSGSPVGNSYSGYNYRWYTYNSNIASIADSGTNQSVSLYGAGIGSTSIIGYARDAFCTASSQGPATVQVPPPTLTLSPPLWFFGLSNNPPQTFTLGNNYGVVTAQGASGGSFAWSITNGASKVSFASGTQQSAITTSSNTVTVYSIGSSTSLNDSTIQLSWTPVGGSAITSTLNLTVDSPSNLAFYSSSGPTGVIACGPAIVANNPIGWWVQYQWTMVSFTGLAMAGISANEYFTNESDQQNNNWSFTPNGFPGTAGASILTDNYCLANQTAAKPIFLPPQNPLLTSSVDSATQTYYVGSQNLESGVAVQNQVLTRYQDHATVTGITPLR